MAKLSRPKIGPRDIDIFSAIDRCPLTVQQLLKLSQTFEHPFTSSGDLRRRLRILTKAGLLLHWTYAIATAGRCPEYFKLSRDGYRQLYGQNAPLPKRRHFESISPGHHHHTLSLADVIVHLNVMAHRHGHRIESFARENSICLKTDPFTVYPDAAFVIRRSDGRSFAFCLELDNGSERVRTKHDVESIERKLRAYDAHQAQYDKFDSDRYLVIFVTTRSEKRLNHILQSAATVMQQPQRTVFIGSGLNSMLECDPYSNAIFHDQRGLNRTLIPRLGSDRKSVRIVPQKKKTVVV